MTDKIQEIIEAKIAGSYTTLMAIDSKLVKELMQEYAAAEVDRLLNFLAKKSAEGWSFDFNGDKYYRSTRRDSDHEAEHEAGMEALHQDYMADCGQR